MSNKRTKHSPDFKAKVEEYFDRMIQETATASAQASTAASK